MAKKKNTNSSSDGEYDEPQVPNMEAAGFDDDGDDDDVVEMLNPPDDEVLQEQLDGEEMSGPLSSDDAPSEVAEAKAEIEALLSAKVEAATSAQGLIDVDNGDMIQGVGIGSPEIDMDQIGSDGPGGHVLNVYTAEKLGQEDCRRCLFDEYGVKSVADDTMALNVFETGIIDTQPQRHKQRPAPCGISVGHFRITAGTLGALATGRSDPRNRRVLMLSNNHVLANSNGGRYGDAIIQPGRADGGKNPSDRVAILERFVPINFSGGANYVDCATGWCWHNLVRSDFIYRSGNGFKYFKISTNPRAAFRGMIVGKTGRTTQLKCGRITDTSATIRVNFGGGRVALFRDQLGIKGVSGDFSAGGDSGSLIWTWDKYRRPVGLLFAGGGGMTFGNKIGRVLSALDIRLRA